MPAWLKSIPCYQSWQKWRRSKAAEAGQPPQDLRAAPHLYCFPSVASSFGLSSPGSCTLTRAACCSIIHDLVNLECPSRLNGGRTDKGLIPIVWVHWLYKFASDIIQTWSPIMPVRFVWVPCFFRPQFSAGKRAVIADTSEKHIPSSISPKESRRICAKP